MDAIDLSSIVNNFYEDIFSDPRRSDFEGYVLVLIPLLLAQIAIFRPVDGDFISAMSTALAIFFGFTFSSMMATARYTAKDDPIEKKVVRETRIGTSYALVVNLAALLSVIFTSILVTDYSAIPTIAHVTGSAVVYFFMFHYLIVMVYLMKYMYLLAVGGAFEGESNSSDKKEESDTEEKDTMKVETID